MRTGRTGQIERERRYDLTNLHRGRLKSEPILAVVRAHWGIENHGHWTMEVIGDADRKVWCGPGVGIQVRGWVRLMAYNLVSRLRCRDWRTREQTSAEKRRWPEGCDRLFLLISPVDRDLFPHRQATAGS